MLEAPDPLSPDTLRATDHLERELSKIGHVEPHSLLTLFSHGTQPGEITDSQAQQLRKFATGTEAVPQGGPPRRQLHRHRP